MPSFIAFLRQTLNLFLAWLARVPVDDPIDRRNAPTMQLLFFVIGTTLPLNWAMHLAAFPIPSGWQLVMAMDMVTTVLAFAGIYLIRRGAFKIAIVVFLGALLVGLQVGYLRLGFQGHLVDQTSQMLSLVISGLVLGRRALWLVFAALMTIFLSGSLVDAQRTDGSSELAFHFLPSAIFSYFVITLVLDRSLTALRESLRESEAQGRQLQREMAESERSQALLLHSQKLEATGRLASGVAHDFNNILSVVLGFTSERHRLDDPASDPRRDANALADALEGIETSAQRGVALIKRLLCFGRQEPVSPELFDARDTLGELKPMLRQLFAHDVLLEMKLAKDSLSIFIDKAQFELMILNVASNARDAMPNGGLFKIEAYLDKQSRSVCIRMEDSGNGIEHDIQSRVFEPFFSTKPAGSGAGLGLAVTHALVSGAHGEIVLDSEPGRGTLLCIKLPCCDVVTL